jgi:NADH:ubiquinone oxidoreductase subunit D
MQKDLSMSEAVEIYDQYIRSLKESTSIKREKNLKLNETVDMYNQHLHLLNKYKIFEKPILSNKEVAILLNKSVGTIRRYVANDYIPYRKKKSQTYFILDEILEWIDQGD